jgi:hypothetical protein
MSRFDDILHSALRSKTALNPSAHPDPDLLSAFAEQTLKKKERAGIVLHLSACAECRELLSLISTEPIPEPKSTRWPLRWPMLRWPIWTAAAAVAACCALIYLSVLFREPASPPILVAKSAIPPALEPPAAPVVGTPLRKPVANKTKFKTLAHQPPQPSLAAEPVPSIPPVQSAPPPVEEALASAAPPQQVQIAPSVPSASQFVLPGTATPRAAAAIQSFKPSVRAKTTPLSVRWSINASPDAATNSRGDLQRSLDNGRTWETVHVADQVSFQAVAVEGSQIWAGGSDGMLFQSSDSGAHWDRVTVADGDRRLTGAITGINLSLSHLDLATSSGEKWISTDGGLHWK